MGQVNVNSGGEPAGSSGSGFILGIIVAIIVIAALVYFLVLNPGNGGGNGGTDDNGNGDPAPSGWMLEYHA
jgi:hypothetical protein